MNDAVHQLLQLIQQGLIWVLRTIESLWVWSWSQIASAFNLSWGDLPAWKMIIGLIAFTALAAMLIVICVRGMRAFSRIATAFWTMAVTMAGVIAFVLIAGLFSRGFQWVVASVPDDFWQRLL